jgi:DNA repair exonuclease SbcCD ATPase subunit
LKKYYPPAVNRKAKKLEQLVLRLEAGEELAQLCQELELKVSPKRAEQLKSKYEAGGRQWEVLLDGRFGHAQQVNSAVRAYLYERKQADQELTAGELATAVEKKYKVRVSEGHINHILREVALTRLPGRPRKRSEPEPKEKREAPQAHAGLFFPGRGEAGTEGHRDDRKLSD